jgi:uncharacterized protein YegJ (DUF2314 family)
MRRVALIFSLLIALIACNGNKEKDKEPVIEDDGIISVEGDDPEMNIAVAKAKGSFDTFREALIQADSTQANHAVKMGFDYDDGREHMWFADLHMKNGKLYGVLDNVPAHIKSMDIGDTVEIMRDRVTDWMYIKDSKLVGGYTLRVLYKRMSKEEKRQFREQTDFDIE